MVKKVFIGTLALCMLFMGNESLASEGEDTGFQGSRRLCAAVSQSDLENYVSGGRYTLEMLFRTSGFDWMNYRIYTKDRTTYAEISYEFHDFEEYVDKTGQLLGYEPAIIYFSDNSADYAEGFLSQELMNWLIQDLEEKELISERKAEELFVYQDSVLNLFGKEWTSVENMDLREESAPSVLEHLSIHTVKGQDGEIERRIDFSMQEEAWNTAGKAYFEKNRIQAGIPVSVESENGQTNLSCEISAYSYQQMANQTFALLGVPDMLEQEQKPAGTGLQTRIREKIDFQKLMSEGCEAEIVYELEGQGEELEIYSEDAAEEDGKLSYRGAEAVWMEFGHPDRVQFKEISVHTKVNSLFGRKERTITFALKKSLAEYFHENIKSMAEERMIWGSTLNIYDDGDIRYYKVSFSSCFDRQLLDFTERILESGGSLRIENTGFFFNKNVIEEHIDLWDGQNAYQKPERFLASYELPFGSLIEGGKENLETDLNETGRIHISYRYFDWKIWAGAYGIALVSFVYLKLVFGRGILKKQTKKQ